MLKYINTKHRLFAFITACLLLSVFLFAYLPGEPQASTTRSGNEITVVERIRNTTTHIIDITGLRGTRKTRTVVPSETVNITNPTKTTGTGNNIVTVGETGSGIQPFSDAPPCSDHDNTKYHGIWNYEKGCHYDHTHGHNPYNTVFKEIVEKWDRAISYPWQTPGENETKHKGYIYLYTEAKNGCEQLGTVGTDFKYNCVTHVLYQTHSLGTTMAMTTRFHSFRTVARVCDKETVTKCGFVETGGWQDYGTLHCPYKSVHCALDTDPSPLLSDGGVLPNKVAIDQPPYRAMPPISMLDNLSIRGHLTQFWSTLGPNPINYAYFPDRYNIMFGSAWHSRDAWGSIDPANPNMQHFICEEGDCKFNHSTFQLFTARFGNIPSGPYSGFTDTRGNVVFNCTQTGPNCVPLIVTAGVPGGSAQLNKSVNPANEILYDYDICFTNQGEVASCALENTTTSGWIKPHKGMVGVTLH
jgi:hypothetical protein